MCEVCTDGRFEIIAAYKQKLIDGTNIESSPDEMAVIDNILFRFWQMGWLIGQPRPDMYARLKAYEDTGLTPEEIVACKTALMGKSLAEIRELNGVSVERMIELANAEAEGRLVVLPCKLGEPIFRIETGYCDWRDQDRCAAYCDGYDYACPDYRADKEVVYGHFTFSDASRFGKTVFLSREEAEAKLKEAKEND